MAVTIDFALDAWGFHRAQSASYPVLCAYLEQDVQGSVASCDLVLAECARVQADAGAVWEATGNALTAVISSRE